MAPNVSVGEGGFPIRPVMLSLPHANGERGASLGIFSLGFFLIAVVAARAVNPAVAQARVTIGVGGIPAPASLVPLLFLKPGVAKHHGKSYTFEPIYFSSSTLQITAISQGELDLAGFGYTSFPLAIQNADL